MADVSPRPARHPLTLLGVGVTTLSALVFVLLWMAGSLGWATNPYLGLLVFVAVPLLFVVGLLLIPMGLWLTRRRDRRGLAPITWPRLDLNERRTQMIVLGIAVATMANVALLMAAGYGAVHYMDSPSFCGAVCHEPMQPQYVQWQQAPHARVACAHCHVGAEPGSFIKAKLAGTRQLAHVLTGRVPRPIPSPRDLPGTAGTCEQCHSTAAFSGDRTTVRRNYADDEMNSETVTTVTLHVGPGGTGGDDGAGNIHWHAQPGRRVEYVPNAKDANAIDWVRVTEADGRQRVYVSDGVTAGQPSERPQLMDCVTCHNRAAHPFSTTAERVVDVAMARGALDRTLPFLRRESVRLLSASYGDTTTATEAIAQGLQAFYAKERADLADSRHTQITEATRVLQDTYRRFVFPAMKVTWGTYPNQLGHTDAPGCFRCHDDGHRATDGSAIRQDCTLCHAMPQ